MKRPSPIIRHELGHSGTTLEAMELRVTARVRSSYTASVDFGKRKLSNRSAASTLRFEKPDYAQAASLRRYSAFPRACTIPLASNPTPEWPWALLSRVERAQAIGVAQYQCSSVSSGRQAARLYFRQHD